MHRSRHQQCARFRWLAAVCFWASSGTFTSRTDRSSSRSAGTRQIDCNPLRHESPKPQLNPAQGARSENPRELSPTTAGPQLIARLEFEALPLSCASIQLESCCRWSANFS